MRQKILIVDDDPGFCTVLFIALTAWGYDVQTINDSRAALDLVLATPPDVVLLDIRMPDIDGLEFMRQARALRPHQAFIVLSGAVDEQVEKTAMEIGAVDFIAKPVEYPHLKMALEAILAAAV